MEHSYITPHLPSWTIGGDCTIVGSVEQSAHFSGCQSNHDGLMPHILIAHDLKAYHLVQTQGGNAVAMSPWLG
jgi:hypothetical protein